MNIREAFKERKFQIISMLLVYLAIALWLGGTVYFGFGVASQVFTLTPSRDMAGELNRAFLHRLNILELFSAVLLVGGMLLYNFRFQSFFHRAPVFLAVISITLLCIYMFIITPQMNDLLLKISSFDTMPDPVLKAKFDTYHVMYSTLVKINLFLLFVIFVWQTLIYAAGENSGKAEGELA